jgi:glucan phosphoethanolaminetransferase (alkaline phosphatase superfamily)
MIGNILNTDARESSGLLHISIVPYLLAFAVLPTLLMWWVKVRPSKWI